MFKKVLATGAMLAMAASTAHAQTQTVIYSNIDNFSGYADTNGSATSGAGPTALTADDIDTLSGFTGQEVTGFDFSVCNFNAEDVDVSPTISFYNSDPTTGAPTTLITSVAFGPITAAGAGEVDIYTAPVNASGYFALPSTFFWAGISFTSTTASTTELNNIGQGIFDPPTVGSSQDAFFQSAGPDTVSSNPTGGIFYFGGTPVANFGWEFEVTAAPEPSQYAALGLGILGIGALALKARRRSVIA